MAFVELRPGDTLSIIWPSTQETPFGVKKIESRFSFEYADLVTRLNKKQAESKSRKSGNEGARFSRIVALASNALKKGTWSTGASIKRSEVFHKLMERFHQLEAKEYENITENAKNALLHIYKDEILLTPAQKEELKFLLNCLGLAHHSWEH